jgi:NADPH2:quinone reductase
MGSGSGSKPARRRPLAARGGYRACMPKAIVVEKIGGPEVLTLSERDPGAPGPGQVRVRVAAAGVNFIDVYFRTGHYPRPRPFVAGLEGAGRVEAVGPDVRDLAVGDRVAWATAPGSYAELIVAQAGWLVRVPDAVPDDVAAAAMLQGMTAHYLVHAIRPPVPGGWALVHAAAGGTGLMLVQTLRAAGMRVVATCGSAPKATLARDAGAEVVVRYDSEDFVAPARAATGGVGVDVVYDGVGQATFEGSLKALRPRGLLALFGAASGPVPPFDLQRLNAAGSLLVTRPALGHFVATRAELEERAGSVLGAIAAGKLSVRIGVRIPLAQASAAHRALEGRGTTGKLLLIP